MKLPEVHEGLAFGVGGTNFRTALVDAEGNIDQTFMTPTPRTPEEFFGETAIQMLQAAHMQNAKWAVLGVPGPVTVRTYPNGMVDQRLRVTNIPALNNRAGLDPVDEMIKADSAMDELIRADDFTFLAINDGDLAAQAAASLYGKPNFDDGGPNVIADLINGTGTGGALVRRDTRFPDANLFHSDPGLWEVGHIPISPAFPSRTIESTISGTAISKHLEKSTHELAANDPIFEEVAQGLGKLVLDFGIHGGAELVVISGGIGVGTQDYYKDDLHRILDNFARSHNPMADKVPLVKFPPLDMADTYEMHGARGAMISFLTQRAVDALVAETD